MSFDTAKFSSQKEHDDYWAKHSKKWAYRRHIYKLSERQNHRCCYCGKHTHIEYVKGLHKKDQATVEHVIPRGNGGSNKLENLVMACLECNNKRSSWCDAYTFYDMIQNPEKFNQFFGDMQKEKNKRDIEKHNKRSAITFEYFYILWNFKPQEMNNLMLELKIND